MLYKVQKIEGNSRMTDNELLLAISNMIDPVRKDILGIKEDVQEIREDIQEIKRDVQELKIRVKKLK